MSTRCPEPGSSLPELEVAHVLAWSGPVARLYFSKGDHPSRWSAFRSYGPLAHMRFDHHTGQTRPHPTRAIGYGAIHWQPDPLQRAVSPLDVAVLECFTQGTLDRRTGAPRLAAWRPTRELTLLKLSDDNWLAQAHGNAALTSGARGVARRWSQAIYAAYPGIDGVVWSSSVHPGGRAIALYERARSAVPRSPSVDRALTEPFLQPRLALVARTYGLTLI